MREAIVRTARGAGILPLLNPWAMLRNLWTHRELIVAFARREIQGRYRAAQLGLVWSILTPLILLVIYTFVFSVVFNARWGEQASESKGVFALTMFCGLLLFNLFSEVVNRAPGLIVNNVNYVKKVVFPLETFVPSVLLGGLFNLLVGLGVWLIGRALIVGWPPWTMVLLPAVLLPVCLTTAGLAWVLASLGVFIRDVGHAVGLLVQVLFFTTPIFYSLDRVPRPYRGVLEINPLTHAVEDARRVLMWGGLPEWRSWLLLTGASAGLALLGYAFFMKSKRAFADVI